MPPAEMGSVSYFKGLNCIRPVGSLSPVSIAEFVGSDLRRHCLPRAVVLRALTPSPGMFPGLN